MEIVAWVLQGILAAMFLIAGFGKITGSQMHRDNFTRWGLPQWFRVVTGIIEVGSVILLVIGFWQKDFAIAGAVLLILTAIGGTLTHIRVKDGFKDTFMIVLLGIMALALLLIIM
ncbi:MAG: DoxX family protein [Bacillaceae bacterium]